MQKEYEYRKLKPIELIDEEDVNLDRCNKVRCICSSDGRNLQTEQVFRFQMNLPEVIENCYGFSVTEFATNKTLFQNMTTQLGNVFKMQQGANIYYVGIPDGWWSHAAVATYITRVLSPAVPGFAMLVMDANKIAFVATSSITLLLLDPDFTLHDFFGFTGAAFNPSGTFIASIVPPSIRTPDAVTLNSIELTNNKYKTQSNYGYSTLNYPKNQLTISDLTVPTLTATQFARELIAVGDITPQVRFPSTRNIKVFDLFLSTRSGASPESLIPYISPSAQWYAVIVFFCK
jgi:hypothetical protein